MELAYTRKPTIRLIATDNAPADKVAQIGYGIEEEGIPFSLVSPDELSDPVSLAHVAATQSQLLVGIACDGRDAVLHYRNLPLEKFIYRIKYRTTSCACLAQMQRGWSRESHLKNLTC